MNLDRAERVQRDRDSARRFFSRAGRPVDQQIDDIEEYAALFLEDFHTKGFPKSDANRWVADKLHLCAIVFGEPAPESLVQLAVALLQVSKRPRVRLQNRLMFLKAAQFVAANPLATNSAIRKGIGYDELGRIKEWRKTDAFKEQVEYYRLSSPYSWGPYCPWKPDSSGGGLVKKALLPP